MNVIWLLTVILSTLSILFSSGELDFTQILSDGAESSIELILSLAGIMAIWGGLMNIAEQSGITNFFAKLLKPLISLLFSNIKNDKSSTQAISMNITANVLGLGNAATPLGIEAMQRLKKFGGNSNEATDEMITFVIINTASVQLIPTTTAVLRAKYGSLEPMSILPAVFLSSICSLIVGLVFDRILKGKTYA